MAILDFSIFGVSGEVFTKSYHEMGRLDRNAFHQLKWSVYILFLDISTVYPKIHRIWRNVEERDTGGGEMAISAISPSPPGGIDSPRLCKDCRTPTKETVKCDFSLEGDAS